VGFSGFFPKKPFTYYVTRLTPGGGGLKFFEGVEILYGRENLGRFWMFSSKNPSKLKKIPKRGGGVDLQTPS